MKPHDYAALGDAIEDTAAAAGWACLCVFAFDLLCDFAAWVMA